MRLHSSFVLFTVQNQQAFGLYKGSEIKLVSELLDDRIFQFISHYKNVDFSSDIVPDHFPYSASEIADLQKFFIRVNVATKMQTPVDDFEYLAHLLNGETLGLSRAKRSICWISYLNDANNLKISQQFPFPQEQSIEKIDYKSFCVVFIDSYNRVALSRLAKILFDKKCKWLLVQVNSFHSWLGPIGSADSTFCIQCVLERIKFNQDNMEIYGKMQGTQFSDLPALPHFFVGTICGYLHSEIVKHFTGDSSDLKKGIYEIGLYQPSIEFSEILPMPNCSVCE